MPDYKNMYETLFGAATQAILVLQQAQQQTEDMYISAAPPDIRALKNKNNAPRYEGEPPLDE